MQASPRFEFIAAAYAAGIAVIGALVAWVVLDYRLQRRFLTELESKGIPGVRRANRSSKGQLATHDGYDGMSRIA